MTASPSERSETGFASPRPFWRSREVRLILVCALGIRILWAAAVPVVPVSDSAAYDLLAVSLAEGDGYAFAPGEPSAYWPVGASAVYSVLYRVFGHAYWPAAILHILLGIAMTALAMFYALERFGPGPAQWTGAFLAVWPALVQFTTVLASELPFIVLMLSSLIAWTLPRGNFWIRAVVAGICIALASYVRPTALLFPVVFAFAHIVQGHCPRKAIGGVGIMLAVMALCIAPWTLRNIRVFGDFALISTNGGANLWMGNNPDTTGEYMPLPESVESMSETARNAYLKQTARAYILAEPGAFVVRTVKKLVRLHDRETIGVVWNREGLSARYPGFVQPVLKGLSELWWLAMLALAIAGTLVYLRKRGLRVLLGEPAFLLWAYFAAVHAVIVIQDRYHFPSNPFIAMFAAFTVHAFLSRKRGVAGPAS